MQLGAIVPAATDRALFVGQTGSGKTTLARVLLAYRKFVLVYDGKGTVSWPGYHLVRSLDALVKVDPLEHPRITYRPDAIEQADDHAINEFFGFAYERRNTTVYVDEVYSVVTGARMPFQFRACLTRGREHKVEVWSATQRPAWVPQEIISEAEHVYAFRLKLAADRDRVESFAGIESSRIFGLAKRDFIYSRQDGEARGPLRLTL